MEDKNIAVGEYNQTFNNLLNINIKQTTVVRSKGLPSHLLKHGHAKCLKYIDFIPDIISNPDFVGVNPNETGESIELVKRYKDNVLIGLKVDTSSNTLYVSTMFDLQETKLQRRLHSGRLVPYNSK